MVKKEKGACEVCGKSPRALNPIDSGHKICNACLKELRPPRPRHLATIKQIERARSFGFDLADDATKDQVNKCINSYYQSRHREKKIAELKRKLSHFRVTEEDWTKREIELEAQFKTDVSLNDLVWGMYNLAITRARTHDELSRLYWDMAFILYNEGRNCIELRRRAATEYLLDMKEKRARLRPGSIEGIRVLGSCTPSSKLERKIINLDDAISDCPIPCKGCDRDKGEKQSWCACSFVFEFND